ncbi:MAG: hypothetical protein ACOCXJ_03845, partial [Planctomycetota bacterium]
MTRGWRLMMLLMLLLQSQRTLTAADAWPSALGPPPQAWLQLAEADSLVATIAAQGEAAGLPAGMAGDWFARWVYGCASLAGVDLHRPARLFWHGSDEIFAVIPLADRQRFIQDFGALPLSGIDLVRTGERDGTIIYAWNGPEAIHEYRLLIRDGTAYLAPDVAACQALAGTAWPHLRGDEPPLRYVDLDPDFRFGGLAALLPEEVPPALRGLLHDIGDAVGASLADGFVRLVGEVRRGPGERWHLHASLDTRAGTSTAEWLARQNDRSSRLLPALPHDRALASWYGHIDWGGQLATAGILHALLHQRLGDGLRPAGWNEALRLFLSQQDQRGAFAGVLIEENDELRSIGASRHPQPAAWRLARQNLVDLYREPLARLGWQLSDDPDGALVGEQRLHWTTVRHADAVWWGWAQAVDAGLFVEAGGAAPATTLIPLVVPVLKHLEQTGPPVGEAVLAALRCDAAAWMRRWARRMGAVHAADIAPVLLEVQLTADQQGRLLLNLPIDPAALADAHQAAGLRLEHWRA